LELIKSHFLRSIGKTLERGTPKHVDYTPGNIIGKFQKVRDEPLVDFGHGPFQRK